jgi:hypothetical protein
MQYRTPAACSHKARSALESRHCVPSPAPCWQVERALKRATTNYNANAGMVVCSSGLQAAFNVARTMDGSCRKPFSLADVGARRAVPAVRMPRLLSTRPEVLCKAVTMTPDTPCGGHRNARYHSNGIHHRDTEGTENSTEDREDEQQKSGLGMSFWPG